MKTLFAPTSASKTDMAKPLSALIEEASFADTKDEESVMALEGLLHQADLAEHKLVRLQTLRQIGKTRGFDKPILEMAASEGLVVSAELAAENFSLSVRPSSTRNALAVAALDKKEIALAQEGIKEVFRKIRNFFAESLDNFLEAQSKYKSVLEKVLSRLENATLDEVTFGERKIKATTPQNYADLFKGLSGFGVAFNKYTEGTFAVISKISRSPDGVLTVGGKKVGEVVGGLYKTAAAEIFRNGLTSVKKMTVEIDPNTGEIRGALVDMTLGRAGSHEAKKATAKGLGYNKANTVTVVKGALSVCTNTATSAALKKIARQLNDAIIDAGGSATRDASDEAPENLSRVQYYRKAITITTKAVNSYRGVFKDVMREVTTVAAAAVASIQK